MKYRVEISCPLILPLNPRRAVGIHSNRLQETAVLLEYAALKKLIHTKAKALRIIRVLSPRPQTTARFRLEAGGFSVCRAQTQIGYPL